MSRNRGVKLMREEGKMTEQTTDYVSLNAHIALKGSNGGLQLEYEPQAVDAYLREAINPRMRSFADPAERVDELIAENYLDPTVYDAYPRPFVTELTDLAIRQGHTFPTLMSAVKFYGTYALTSNDGTEILETYEDRVVANALLLAEGDTALARELVVDIVNNLYQPATPTFLNAGKLRRGEMVSCYSILVGDDMNSIGRSINSALQLSKRGGGVALGLTDIREAGAPIKGIEGAASGVVPIMKLYEDSFSYANQLGQRQGAGAVYISAHHPDVVAVLDTKRENADEKIRIKTLSVGLVVPDITFELAKAGKDMALFSPYDVKRKYGVELSHIGITEHYDALVADDDIKKRYIPARKFFQMVAEIQAESGYPYLMFEDTVNKDLPVPGRVVQSNLCVTGDTFLLTDSGYVRAFDLYRAGNDLNVISDNRVVNDDVHDLTVSVKPSTRMMLTTHSTEVYTVRTREGFEVCASPWHKFFVEEDGLVAKKPLTNLRIGDKLLIQPAVGAFGKEHDPEGASALGEQKKFDDSLLASDEETQSAFFDALFRTKNWRKESLTLEAGSREDVLRAQMMLLNLGVWSHVYGPSPLLITDPFTRERTVAVAAVDAADVADVFDVTVEDGHSVIFNGLSTSQCSEILQPQDHSVINDEQGYDHLGHDVICNLGSIDVARVLDEGERVGEIVTAAVRALNAVNEIADVGVVPSIENTQRRRHPIGLGAMNFHGALAINELFYGSAESVEFAHAFFSTVNYWTLSASSSEAQRRGDVFEGFEDSTYADGTYFDKYVETDYRPRKGGVVADILADHGFSVPSPSDWAELRERVMSTGLWNAQREAIPPTGSISYLSGATASVWPVVGIIENRKEGRTGRLYVPAYGLTSDNAYFYESAYDVDKDEYFDVIAAIQEHVDQGISTNLFFKGEGLTTAQITKAHAKAWAKGLKTLYYTRIANAKIIGQESSECVACAL